MKHGLAALTVARDTAPMEARLTGELPRDGGWQFEPKWDGFRCLVFRSGDDVDLVGKSGKSLARYFPEVATVLRGAAADRLVLDGELAVPVGDTLSFEALQMRLHPAESRIRRLASATPAILILFDCLATGGDGNLIDAPLEQRRAALENVFGSLASADRAALRLTPCTRDRKQAQRWLDWAGGALDGVVAKRLDGRYEVGEHAMLKIKQIRTADCVVGGFRYASGSRTVGSLLLGLYNDQGKLDHVGYTSSIADAERAALTWRLETLRGEPGFTGNAPGGRSRWSTERSGQWEPLRPEMVAEVRYDHVTGDRFRHGTMFLRWRPDKAPRQCTFAQFQPEARPRKLLADVI